MIHYDQWFALDARLNEIRRQQNEASAARMYAILKPVREATGLLSSVLRGVWKAWCIQARRRAAFNELHGLDDRLLKDIGISRSQISRLVETGQARAESNRPEPAMPEAAESKPPRQILKSGEIVVLSATRSARLEWQRDGVHDGKDCRPLNAA